MSDWSSGVCSSDLALLVDDTGEVRRDWLRSVIADIAERGAAGQEIIIVSSGSSALGARRLGLAKGGRANLEDAQAAAAAGQILLSGCYADLLGADRKSTRLNSSH